MFFSVITKNSNWEILTKNLVTFLKEKMVLRVKNFDIFGVHLKIRFLGGVTENQYRGENCLKRGGLGWFSDLRGGLARKREVVFSRGGGLIPQCTLC